MHSARDYLIAEYTADRADETVQLRRRRMISSAVSLGLSLVISLVFYLWRREQFEQNWEPWVLVGVATALSLLRLLFWLVAWRRAVADRARVGVGPALVIGRFGVELHGVRLDWPRVERMLIGPGRLGAGPEVVVRGQGTAPLSVGLEHLDVRPAALESATRIYSGGQRSLDLSRLDD
ncbi:hypothetical protein GC722_04875 [Auraticoccus sp. F435]|uniref:Uncharacterized protein n=1 Tax=Auraticoccus cholistanensis TaxID=2656650 RepID=A0A6A9UUF0_9ACTN|nr:hypothetical protein [Auraticoccus cholistanensis]MVA75365.1 hypothetical protein [Auraticoccus cholistanensis]